MKNWYILYIHSKKPPEFSSEGILNRVVTPLSTGFIGKPGVFLSHSSSDKYILTAEILLSLQKQHLFCNAFPSANGSVVKNRLFHFL